MAKTSMHYFGLVMHAEGEEAFCQRQTETFLAYVNRDAERREREDYAYCCAAHGIEDLSDAPEEVKREILRNDAALRAKEQAKEADTDEPPEENDNQTNMEGMNDGTEKSN